MFTSLVQAGILNKLDGDGISDQRLNDEVETENSPTKGEEIVGTEAQTTKSAIEKNQRPDGEKNSDDGLEKSRESSPEQTTAQIEEESVAHLSFELATKMGAQPVVEMTTEPVT